LSSIKGLVLWIKPSSSRPRHLCKNALLEHGWLVLLMSAFGASRRFAAPQYFGSYRRHGARLWLHALGQDAPVKPAHDISFLAIDA
jgi:hypothetical protein